MLTRAQHTTHEPYGEPLATVQRGPLASGVSLERSDLPQVFSDAPPASLGLLAETLVAGHVSISTPGADARVELPVPAPI